jgi:L-iditol 2-dehydrogenase
MIAAVYHGPEDLRVESFPAPAAGAGDVVLRVDCASICATDLRILRGAHRKYAPGVVRIPGHEVVGTIVEVGRGVSHNYQVGQRVFVAPNVGCGHCPQCEHSQNNLCAHYDALGITLDGAFAEFMRIPAPFLEQGNLIPFDEALEGAAVVLAEPFACVLHGQEALQIRREDVVLILGTGPIGIMHVIAARAAGASKILVSGRVLDRLRMAQTVGADRAVNFAEESLPEVVAAETRGRGANVIVVAVGAREAIEAAPALAAIGGRINFFGALPSPHTSVVLDANLVHYRELVITGTTGCSTTDCRRSMDLIASRKIDLGPLISRRYSLTRAPDAFADVRAGKVLKVILHPNSNKE